ncbi:MAG: WD40 repeat domain-containing protein, partial [Cytophagales bacterium]|nr:WD40 repeat domain-containing protein [Cytophagales bacterium]
MAVKSLQIEDTSRKTLVAYQAYLFNKNNGGSSTNHDIYDGLYYALKNLKEEEYNSLKGHTDAVRSVVYSSDGKTIYTAGSDGKILQWKSGQSQAPVVIAQNGYINRVLSLSGDNKWLACGSDMASVQLFDLTQSEIKPIMLKGNQAPVSTLVFSTDNNTLYTTGSDGLILAWDVKSATSTQLVKSASKIKMLSINPATGDLAGINDRGQVVLWDKANGYQEKYLSDKVNRMVHAISYSFDGKFLAIGNEAGKIKLWNVVDNKVEAILAGHKARINDLKFSKDGKMLASASFDGSVRLWNITNLNEPPIEMKDHNSWVWSMAFSPDGNTLIAGCVDNLVRVWPTRLDHMAEQMCAKLKRNMSDKEWQQYVAKDIPYELTCESKPKYTDIKEEE